MRRLLAFAGFVRPIVIWDDRTGHWRAARSLHRPYPCRHHDVVTVDVEVDSTFWSG